MCRCLGYLPSAQNIQPPPDLARDFCPRLLDLEERDAGESCSTIGSRNSWSQFKGMLNFLFISSSFGLSVCLFAPHQLQYRLISLSMQPVDCREICSMLLLLSFAGLDEFLFSIFYAAVCESSDFFPYIYLGKCMIASPHWSDGIRIMEYQ